DFMSTGNLQTQANLKDSLETQYSSHNLKSTETQMIKKILLSVNGNRSKAAEILGISRTTLWRKLKSMGLIE
ncbi:MAG: helix-turn-helix domain-containing protein, partial [Bacteroidales bacterium]